MLRRLVYAVAGVLALAPLALIGPASAAVTHPAATADSTCHDSSIPNNIFGYLYASGGTAGSELYSNLNGYSTWCRDLTGVPAGWEMLRLQYTSLCAEYSGPATGGDSSTVKLATCHANRLAQLWAVDHLTNGAHVVRNDYAFDGSAGGSACLSSDEGTYEKVHIVTPAGGCDGNGGQDWNFPAP